MHRVLSLQVRPSPGAPTEPRDHLVLVEGKGIDGDHAFGRMRHVTIVFEDDWAKALVELGREVDPAERRANVVVSGGDGPRFVGRRIRLGSALLDVKGIVAPCPVMDRAAEGLRAALEPDGRAGIWGRVLEGGEVHPGDTLTTV